MSVELPTSDPKLCTHSMSDHTGFYFHPCHKPAKFVVKRADETFAYRCGIHVKRQRKHMANGHSVIAVEPI